MRCARRRAVGIAVKILHVVAYFPPDRMGGVGEVVAHLHRALLAAGHASHVLTTGSSRDDPTVERIAERPLAFLTRLRAYAERAREFDLIHCHHGDAVLMLLAMRVRRVPTPVLATYHVGHRGMARAHAPYRFAGVDGGRRFDTGAAGFVYRHGTARFHQATDRIVRALADESSFISRSAAVDALGPTRGAGAHVIYNAVPAAGAAECRGDSVSAAKLAEFPEPTELLYVGADGPRKRVLALPYVLESVRRTHPGARLRLVGFELADSVELAQLFAELGLADAVICEGVCPSRDVRRFYRAAQVLLVPSIYEGLPMVILEALGCGLPCVATRVSGHPEVIQDGVNGFLVDPDDPVQMAERCSLLLGDESRRAAFSAAGRSAVAERFSIERQCADYLDLYGTMVGTG